jgi:tetratricopeptide (TPR) repeat protein
MYALNPSPAAAYNMARLFLRRENYEKGVEYLENAVNSETDPFDKANYNHQLGTIMLAHYKRYTDAKRYFLEASKLRPDWGKPYHMLGNTYASGSKVGEDDFEKAYVYWVVVDKLQRAKQVDPDISNTVDPLIRQFQQHFPKKEEGFFRNILEGATVTVGGWIGESTRVRYTN